MAGRLRQPALDGRGLDEARRVHELAGPRDRLEHLRSQRAVPEHQAPQVRHAAARLGDGRGHQLRPLLGDVSAGEHHQRSTFVQALVTRSGGAGIEAGEAHRRGGQALLGEPAGMQLGEHVRLRREACAEPLHELADPPADRAEVLPPVLARPDLEPVDADRLPAAGERESRPEQREVGKRAQVHGVVAPPVGEQVPQHARPEAQRRSDSPLSVSVVERILARDDDHPHARQIRLLAPRPLAPGEVGDVVPGRHERQRQVAIPALGAPDGVGVEAVVGEADLHGELQKAARPFDTIAALRATFVACTRFVRLRVAVQPGSLP